MSKKSKALSLDGLTGGLIRKSRVVYPPDCLTPEARAAFEDQLVRDRQAEVTLDAARDGLTIDRWYIDMDVSGMAKADARRSGLAQAKADAERGLLTTLYTRDLSRIYRSVVKQELFFADMERWGCTVRAQDIPQVGDPATQRLIRQNIGALNEYLAQRTGALMEATKLTHVREGTWVGQANSQWGLLYAPTLGGYHFDPFTADKAVVVFEALAENAGIGGRAVRQLNRMWDEGHPRATLSPHGARWRITTLLQVVRRQVYRRMAVRGDVSIPAPHLIPEVVPPEMVAEVDRLLALRASGPRPKYKAGRLTYTYGGLLSCGECGARLGMNGQSQANAAKTDCGVRWLAWNCTLANKEWSDCTQDGAMQQWRIDQLVARGLAESFALTQGVFAPPTSAKTNARSKDVPRPKNLSQKDTAASALAGLAERRRRVLDMYERGYLTPEELPVMMARIDAEAARIQAVQPEDEVQTPPTLPALTPDQWQRLRALVEQLYAPPTDNPAPVPVPGDNRPLDLAKHTLLKSLGADISVHALLAPPHPTGRVYQRHQRAHLVMSLDVPLLGLTGPRALTLTETDADFAEYRRWQGAVRGYGRRIPPR